MGSCHVVLSCDKQFEYDNHKTEDLFILIDEFADYHNLLYVSINYIYMSLCSYIFKSFFFNSTKNNYGDLFLKELSLICLYM